MENNESNNSVPETNADSTENTTNGEHTSQEPKSIFGRINSTAIKWTAIIGLIALIVTIITSIIAVLPIPSETQIVQSNFPPSAELIELLRTKNSIELRLKSISESPIKDSAHEAIIQSLESDLRRYEDALNWNEEFTSYKSTPIDNFGKSVDESRQDKDLEENLLNLRNNKKIDEIPRFLNNYIQENPKKSDIAYYFLSNYYEIKGDFINALNYATKADSLQSGIYIYLTKCGEYYNYLGEIKKSKEYFSRATLAARNIGLKEEIKTWINLSSTEGSIAQEESEFKYALKLSRDAEKLALSKFGENHELSIRSFQNQSIIQFYYSNFLFTSWFNKQNENIITFYKESKKSEKNYLQTSMKYAQPLSAFDPEIIATNYINLGGSYLTEFNHLHYMMPGVENEMLIDSALLYYEKALEFIQNNPKLNIHRAGANYNVASIWSMKAELLLEKEINLIPSNQKDGYILKAEHFIEIAKEYCKSDLLLIHPLMCRILSCEAQILVAKKAGILEIKQKLDDVESIATRINDQNMLNNVKQNKAILGISN
jgi:hypothetical protein